MPDPGRDEPQQRREDGDAEQLRAQRQRRGGQGERDEPEDRGGPSGCAARDGHGDQQADRRRHEPGTQDRQQLPAAQPVPGREHTLRQPLLVRPGRAGDREGPGVRGGDRAGLEDRLPGADLVREIDRGHRHEQGDERRQRERDDQPQLVEP